MGDRLLNDLMLMIGLLGVLGTLSVVDSFSGSFSYNIDLSHASDFEIVYPRISDAIQRRRRDINSNVYYEEENKSKIVELGDWVLEFNINNNLLLTPQLTSEWVSSDSSVHQSLKQCDYKRGVIKGIETTSTVAMTLCGSEITGFIFIPGAAYFVQPYNGSSNSHILYKSKIIKAPPMKIKRSVSVANEFNGPLQQWEYFNLTGDTMEIDESSELENSIENELYSNGEGAGNLSTNSLKWWREEMDSDEFGYFLDSAWEAKKASYAKQSTQWMSPMRWLEIAVAADHTVIAFHGRQRVAQYVLALMNIVNAIYQDASLEANMQMVITRLLLYENQKQSVVRPGNARKSLENVNTWNRRLHLSLAPGEPRHDVAVWLTRSDIGGPSGYAPVGGVCDEKRSCALNRDEGLTSAFIIAHEMAHILGLSHDGDRKVGNDCGDAALDGSVMAPMVSATFHKFTWSECSRKEFKIKQSQWICLQNSPSWKETTVLNGTIDTAFTMDEQCRMEFGDGYQLCRSFDIIEPCSHLWCGHVSSPLVCKTKKGPPLEGTECGFDKWCINGYCERVDKRRFGVVPILHNPQDGGWSDWAKWGSCSRSCGTGVQFRSRLCNNPPPAYGGNNCFGLTEEWKLCNTVKCPEPMVDLRAQQCHNIIGFLKISDRRSNLTWLPYESEDKEMKCQLICMSKETRELFVTGENLIDGTPCSYDSSSDICIQGTCQPLGCDGNLFSKATEDACGVCKGNNSECSHVETLHHKRIKKEVSKVCVIPRFSRNIVIDANVTMAFSNNPAASFILKNRMKRKYSVPIPSKVAHGEIIEGTKLYYNKIGGRHYLWTKGPFLMEMVILLYAPKNEVKTGLNVSLQLEYYVKKNTINTSSRFRWILGGWGPCSASCGGGKRQKTIACWDGKTNKIVRRKYCSLILKPSLPSEICNTYSCNFHWVTGQWEPCSVTCGSYGSQSRELYCVPKSVITVHRNVTKSELDKPWRYMVNPAKCAGTRPISVRPCYRIPCPSYWEYGDWSQCSASCGSGISTRSTHCPPPEGESFFTCGVHPPMQRKVCRGPFTKRTNPLCKTKKKKQCTDDKSKYCALPTLAKYCKLGTFKRLCCKSCSNFILFPFSF
ncbi:hypothetical protein RI129_001127 [Pyrocoelia pectoralis]|uniref:Uncharacterized protein n=1 Tax=Pyrocoelia pectoralis TaxID=417401 RepID=A0AAN7VVW5_9COLE